MEDLGYWVGAASVVRKIRFMDFRHEKKGKAAHDGGEIEQKYFELFLRLIWNIFKQVPGLAIEILAKAMQNF